MVSKDKVNRIMHIVYVAKHNSGHNDDEGAIASALRDIGHEVTCLPERQGHKAVNYNADLLLFHKWDYHHAISTLQKIDYPKAFWYFDLVDFPDKLVRRRCEVRKQWMERVIPYVDLGFCTDGDWVQNGYNKEKLRNIYQGCDTRITGFGDKTMAGSDSPPILFTGSKNGGEIRSSFVDMMKRKYKSDFSHVSDGVHGRKLADLIARSKFVVCPDGPVTDNYWSNRVWLSSGFGGLVLHPYCSKLAECYKDGKEILFYKDRDQLHELIHQYTKDPVGRQRIQSDGYYKTTREHSYLMRCVQLIEEVRKLPW